jgi:hypothetical protein
LEPQVARLSNILLFMPALDPDAGIHHMTALIARYILADNQWEGYFTEDKEGQKRMETPEDGILMGRNYYLRRLNPGWKG